MKRSYTIDDVVKLAERYGIPVTDKTVTRLKTYIDALKAHNEKLHLISRGDIHCIPERHIMPSLMFLFALKKQNLLSETILDMGTGAGLPGMVLALLYPSLSITLLDSNRKKTLFLKKILSTLDLQTEVLCDRYEFLPREERQKFRVILARAVAPLHQLVIMMRDELLHGATLITLKGIDYLREWNEENNDRFSLHTLLSGVEFESSSRFLASKILLAIKAK